MKDIIPTKAEWKHSAVQKISPESNELILDNGERLSYDYLVVAAGMQLDWKKVPGMAEAVNKPGSGVVSIYDYNYSAETFKAFEQFKGGRVAEKSGFGCFHPDPVSVQQNFMRCVTDLVVVAVKAQVLVPAVVTPVVVAAGARCTDGHGREVAVKAVIAELVATGLTGKKQAHDVVRKVVAAHDDDPAARHG